MKTSTNAADLKAERRFGTFGGVFTPCTLTILGVIMFLRFGHVVGEAGLIYAVAIVLAAKAITVLTALSLSAIATNTRVKGGGAYFLISRSLGVESGGAIGVVLFLAQAISVAMYVIGFCEALVAAFPGVPLSFKVIATVVNVAVFICVYVGAGWTIKVQYFILAVLGLSLISFYTGAIGSFRVEILEANLEPLFSDRETLFVVFALFFPAVTGIMAGTNMSGDLKDPARSIPRGTFAAIGVTAAVYLSQAVVLAGARPAATLSADHHVVREISSIPALITAGIFAATLSSALGSMMGAPRILQAFARDNLFRWLRAFARGSGATGEPRRATLLSFLIAETCILLADLNAIAPIITMAFLLTYGMINLATFFEGITRNPSYRPRFRFSHWSTSLAGALGCVGVMFLIDWTWALVAIVLVALLHWCIGRKEIESRWGDLQSGLLFERTRQNLLKLENELYHPKNWRPIILALSGGGWRRPHLAVYGHWFTTGHGILSLGQVIKGDVEELTERRLNQERILHGLIREQDLQAFPAVVVARFVSEGIESLVQSHGLGALRPNTVLLGWPGSPESAESFGATLRTVVGLGSSIVVARFTEEATDPWLAPAGSVDVWWRGEKNGAMMLLLAHLLTRNPGWRNRPIRLLRVLPKEAGRQEVLDHLHELIDGSRIRATPVAVVDADVNRVIQSESASAGLVFLGFEAPAEGEEAAFFGRMETFVASLRRVVFVDSVGGMSLEA